MTDLSKLNLYFLQVFGDEAEMYKIEDLQMHDLGRFEEVSITKDDTLLIKVWVPLLTKVKTE